MKVYKVLDNKCNFGEEGGQKTLKRKSNNETINWLLS